jgi:DNA-binding response OmpR family regulator
VRLLVVEDEVRFAHALRRGLSADGFLVDVATTGPSGLQAAQDNDYDAVLLDVMLPGMSGYEVVRRLRAEGNAVPVLMLSAKDGVHDQADGLDCGADDYLVKPVSYVVLLAHLRAVLRRHHDTRPPILTWGDVRLDPSVHEVTVAGEPVAVTPREYALLEFFLTRPDQVLTKIELLDRVWDLGDRGTNTVEVYVGYLRRKLGADVIETVRGVGYRLGRPPILDP